MTKSSGEIKTGSMERKSRARRTRKPEGGPALCSALDPLKIELHVPRKKISGSFTWEIPSRKTAAAPKHEAREALDALAEKRDALVARLSRRTRWRQKTSAGENRSLSVPTRKWMRETKIQARDLPLKNFYGKWVLLSEHPTKNKSLGNRKEQQQAQSMKRDLPCTSSHGWIENRVRERENWLADKEIKNQAVATPNNRRETEIRDELDRVPAGCNTRATGRCAAGKFHLSEKPTLLKSLGSRKTQMPSTTKDLKINFFIDNQTRLQSIHGGHYHPSLI
jgi:hypothetical protein